jgi:hypothetical protein
LIRNTILSKQIRSGLRIKDAMFMLSNIRKFCISRKSITVFSSTENETKRFGGKTRKKQTTWKIKAQLE